MSLPSTGHRFFFPLYKYLCILASIAVRDTECEAASRRGKNKLFVVLYFFSVKSVVYQKTVILYVPPPVYHHIVNCMRLVVKKKLFFRPRSPSSMGLVRVCGMWSPILEKHF